MNDRALQDQLILYLTDARQRRQGPGVLPLGAGEARKASRFSNFLARHYYRDRLARSFQYSRQFRPATGRLAEEVVDSPEFDCFLESCVLGSLTAAEQVGASAKAHLAAVPHPAHWWSEMLEYEYAYFLQAATSQSQEMRGHPSPGTSACLRHFSWGFPELFAKVREGKLADGDCRRELTLLFSRTDMGKIYVVEVEANVANLFRAIDGRLTSEEIAASAGIEPEEAFRVLQALATIGAVKIG